MVYDNWGCEFIGPEISVPIQRSLPEAIWLPLELLRGTIDRSYSNSIRSSGRDRIEALKLSIADHGLKEPGILVIGKNSSKLQDGNHRFIAFEELGKSKFPVKIEVIDSRIKTSSLPNEDFISLILKQLDKPVYM